MTHFNGEFELPPSYLVTDLDGTFIPLPDEPSHRKALQEFHRLREASSFGLVFCTGRHFESTAAGMTEFDLPRPDWIICDVGTSVYHLTDSGFRLYPPYQEHLAEKVGAHDRGEVEQLLEPVEHLTLQCESHQGPYKISYECVTSRLEDLVDTVADLLKDRELAYEVHGSVDPFLDCGLIDLLPTGVSKAYAVIWLATHADFTPDEVIYAGDSGNDLSALSAGFRAILVSNASPGLDVKIRERLGDPESDRLLYCASASATAGVLEGCRHFGLFD